MGVVLATQVSKPYAPDLARTHAHTHTSTSLQVIPRGKLPYQCLGPVKDTLVLNSCGSMALLLKIISTMFAPIAVTFVVGILGWAYSALKPPRPKICGSPDGPPITSPRVKLSDGRHLAYREVGVHKEQAKHKVIVIHGANDSKDVNLPISQELMEELQIYFLFFDRAGYGESDPYPSRSVQSDAYDVQELADKLQIGSKFYVIGISMGAYPVYGCLKYIPQRLSGASLVVPFVHYWWRCLPANISRESFQRLPVPFQWTFRIAHYTPWLFYWWMNQTWFPTVNTVGRDMAIFSPQDVEIIRKLSENPSSGQEKILQQGEHESVHRDLIAGFMKWEFDPLDLSSPFPNNEGSVHIWQGYDDTIIPFGINRYVADKVPWIQYHEIPDAGHFMIFRTEICEAIIRALLPG